VNRRLLILPVTIALAGMIALGACTSTPTASVAIPSVAIPSVALPSISLPSISLPSIGAGESFALPSFEIPSFEIPSFSIPSFNTSADPDLAARFPKTVDGQPVTNVQTFRFMEILTAIQTDQAQIDQFTAVLTQAGIDPNTITFGTAQCTVGGSTKNIQAIRSPGGDANRFLQSLAAIAQATGSPIALSPANIGGKNVQVATSGSSADYYYPNGDIAWFLSGVDAATAATILAALP
jgi:hypothetical protein